MLISGIPTKTSVPWANAASPPYVRPIPVPSQHGIQAGAASYTDGFPPETFNPVGAGGTPPWGADFNGILQSVTQWLRWVQAGAPIAYDSAFQTAIGGYPFGALVPSATIFGLYWLNVIDGNLSNPDAGGANWQQVPIASGGVHTTGAWQWRPTQETLTGWMKANATTIGNSGSGASQFADPLAANLFAWLWTNFSNTQCPVSGGRGANPAADFAALKTIQMLDMRGMAPIGMDTMAGAPTTKLNGVPVTSGAPTQAGSILGEILHTLITAELAQHAHNVSDPQHSHGVNDPQHFHQIFGNMTAVVGTIFATTTGIGAGPGTATTDSRSTGISIQNASTGISIQNAGGNFGHNNVSLAMTGTHYFKL